MSEEASEQVGSNRVLLVVSWLWVGLPLVYGVYELMTKASKLFIH